MRRLAAVAVAAGALALVLAAAAGSTIVIGRSIGGVRLGMSQAAVRRTLGRPVRVVHASNEFGTYTEFRYRGYTVDFQGDVSVTSVSTMLRRERTPSGVGVGSTLGQVRSKVPGVACEGPAAVRHCHVGKLLPGRKVTDFAFHNGVVQRITVGVVLD